MCVWDHMTEESGEEAQTWSKRNHKWQSLLKNIAVIHTSGTCEWKAVGWRNAQVWDGCYLIEAGLAIEGWTESHVVQSDIIWADRCEVDVNE